VSDNDIAGNRLADLCDTICLAGSAINPSKRSTKLSFEILGLLRVRQKRQAQQRSRGLDFNNCTLPSEFGGVGERVDKLMQDAVKINLG